jgi:hypothetical protein
MNALSERIYVTARVRRHIGDEALCVGGDLTEVDQFVQHGVQLLVVRHQHAHAEARETHVLAEAPQLRSQRHRGPTHVTSSFLGSFSMNFAKLTNAFSPGFYA